MLGGGEEALRSTPSHSSGLSLCVCEMQHIEKWAVHCVGFPLAGLHLASHLVNQEEAGLRGEWTHPKSLRFFLPIFEGVPALDYSGRSNMPGDKMEAIVLQRLNEKGQSVAVPGRELNHSAKSTRTGNLVLATWPTWENRVLRPPTSLLNKAYKDLMLLTFRGSHGCLSGGILVPRCQENLVLELPSRS